jgi:aminocarboxymuconate-semialdehyde decarboxylase
MLFTCRPPRAPADRTGTAMQARHSGKTLTVDIHCHAHCHAAQELMQDAADAHGQDFFYYGSAATHAVNRQQFKDIAPKFASLDTRLADMDAMGVDIQAVSPSPAQYFYWAEPEAAREAARLVNDNQAAIVASHPDRFVALGSVPMQEPGMALAELDRCINALGLKGIELGTNVDGAELSDRRFEKFFARCEELGIVIFLHPGGFTHRERLFDHYLNNLIGNPLDSTVAVAHLIFEGVLERMPGLKIVVAHGGGYIPPYGGRFDHGYRARADCRQFISQPPSTYLRKLFFDTMVFEPDQLKFLIEKYGADHVMLGTDYPFDMGEADPVGLIHRVDGISDDDRALVLGGAAARLLGVSP